jgi:integrase
MSQTTASAKPITPLRRRMTEDMTVRGFGEKTQSDYIRHVKNFTIFLGRSPDSADGEDLRRFQLHQRQQGVQPPTMNGATAALRFFFTTTCNRPEMARHLRIVKQPRKLPVVLTMDEVFTLIEAAPGPKYKAALGAAYGAGLRVSEVANLKVSDIDRGRMVLRIEQGKGQKDRNGMLSPRLLEVLVNWYDGSLGHKIGKHRDDEKALIADAPIITISFGERRPFRLRRWKGEDKLDVEVNDGSVLILPAATSRAFTHEVPALKILTGLRISVTIRAFED